MPYLVGLAGALTPGVRRRGFCSRCFIVGALLAGFCHKSFFVMGGVVMGGFVVRISRGGCRTYRRHRSCCMRNEWLDVNAAQYVSVTFLVNSSH